MFEMLYSINTVVQCFTELCSVSVGTFVSSPGEGDTIWAGITLLLIGRQAARGAGETCTQEPRAQGQEWQGKGSRGKEGRGRGAGVKGI